MDEVISLNKLNLKNQLIIKSNSLIEAKYKLTLNEQRLILSLIALIKPEDKEFKEYFFKISDLQELFDIKTDTLYTTVKEIAEGLVDKTFIIKEPDGDLKIGWLAQSKYFDNEGVIALAFAPRLKPYLLQLKNHFTAYKLENIFKLKSTYSIRIYELLLKNYNFYKEEKDTFIFKIEDLKEKLGVEKNEYSQIGQFKDYILNQAQKELKAKSELFFEYVCLKTGRKITEIKFIIKIKKKAKKEKKELKEKKEEIIEIQKVDVIKPVVKPLQVKEDDEITKKLKSWGTTTIDEIRAKHSNEVLLNGFKALEFEILKKTKAGAKPISNLGGYFNAMLPKIAGKPFIFTDECLKYIEQEEQKNKQKDLKKQEKEKEEREKTQKEELYKKIIEKIEDLKNNSPQEWEKIEQEVFDKIDLKKLYINKNDKEEKEIIEKIIIKLSEEERNIINKEVLEKAKKSVYNIGIDEKDFIIFNRYLENAKNNILEETIKEKYSNEIKKQLIELKTKSNDTIFTTQKNIIIRSIIRERYF